MADVPMVRLADVPRDDAEPAPVTRAEYQALCLRVWRLEDHAKRLSGLLGAAGQVFDMAKTVERETLNPPPKEMKT